MSYSDTFARRPSESWNRFRAQVAMVGMGLALGVAIGYALASVGPEAELAGAAPTYRVLSHEEFFLLNTTELETPTPTLNSQTSSAIADRGFIYLNTVALDALGPPAVQPAKVSRISDSFLRLNIESLERATTPVTDRRASRR